MACGNVCLPQQQKRTKWNAMELKARTLSTLPVESQPHSHTIERRVRVERETVRRAAGFLCFVVAHKMDGYICSLSLEFKCNVIGALSPPHQLLSTTIHDCTALGRHPSSHSIAFTYTVDGRPPIWTFKLKICKHPIPFSVSKQKTLFIRLKRHRQKNIVNTIRFPFKFQECRSFEYIFDGFLCENDSLENFPNTFAFMPITLIDPLKIDHSFTQSFCPTIAEF